MWRIFQRYYFLEQHVTEIKFTFLNKMPSLVAFRIITKLCKNVFITFKRNPMPVSSHSLFLLHPHPWYYSLFLWVSIFWTFHVNFPLNTALAASQNFWYTVISFPFISLYFPISFVISDYSAVCCLISTYLWTSQISFCYCFLI